MTNRMHGALAITLTATISMMLCGPGHAAEARTSGDVEPNRAADGAAWDLVTHAGPPRAAEPEQDWITRLRTAAIDVAGLRDQLTADVPIEAVGLSMFDDAAFLAQTHRFDAGDDRFTWIATLEGVEAGHAIISARGGVAYGMVNAPGYGLYEFFLAGPGHEPRAGENYVIREIDAMQLPPCGVGPEHCVNLPQRFPRHRGAQPPQASETPVVRVLVAYTPTARDATGGHDAMLAFVDSTMAQTNLAFENSLINLHAELALAYEVDYTESGSIVTDLQRIQGVGNGYMDEIHELRADHAADLVALLTTDDSGACGVAYCMSTPSVDFAPLAFSVTRIECVPNLTFAHELGHNMGCHHDHDNSGGSCGTYPYAFGHSFFGNSGEEWRTVLSYPPGQRIPYFSNPDVLHDGQPTGVPAGQPLEADNMLTITQNTPFVTAFADELQPINCEVPGTTRLVPQEYSSIQAAIDDADHCDVIIVAPGVYNEAINFNGRVVELRSADGPDATTIDATGLSSSVVRFSSGETQAAVLDGFTLIGGTGSTVSINNTNYLLGGGIYVAAATPTIRNCVMIGNSAQFGGAIFNNNASPTIDNCQFIENTSTSAGGGVFNFQNASPHIENCEFIGNVAESGGGAISSQGASATVINSTFTDNSAADDGGAMRNIQNSATTVIGCSFSHNTAGGSGGAIFHDNSAGSSVAESTFCENSPGDIAGQYTDGGGNEFIDECDDGIPGDLTGDGTVGVADLLILIGAWGPCADCGDCPADLTGDCNVGIPDLLILIGNWG